MKKQLTKILMIVEAWQKEGKVEEKLFHTPLTANGIYTFRVQIDGRKTENRHVQELVELCDDCDDVQAAIFVRY